MNLLRFEGEDSALMERLREPLRRALEERRTFYSVRIERIGRVGEVLVCITGSKGRLPLLLRGEEELEAAHVHSSVAATVDRFGL